MLTSRILHAEDSPVIASVVEFGLKQAGLEVELARNGRIAIELARNHRFDVIISDWKMPEVNGEEFCTWLREQDGYRETPIILLTGKEEDLGDALTRFRISTMITKPFSPRGLIDVVTRHLDTARRDVSANAI